MWNFFQRATSCDTSSTTIVSSITGSLTCPGKRRELSASFFRLFNHTVFADRLPRDTAIVWNKRLLTTAGRCLQGTIGDRRRAFIQLSPKICDTAERVRDTLLHEMCHAATWILDGIQHTNHGDCFQYWAERAHRTHPDLPPINSFHTYTIRTPYVYLCTQCHDSIGRHTKSLNVERQVCARCGGRFALQQQREGEKAVPAGRRRTAHSSDSFAIYVRHNMKRMRRRHKNLSKTTSF